MLTIRAALSALGRPLPAFDLVLRRYWDHRHPGEPLEEYLRRGGLTARFGKALPQQMQSAMADVAQALLLPGTVGTAVGQLTGALVRALRERRQTVRALARCARLADLLEAEPDLEALSFYPHLLAWELAQLPADKKVTPVILLDTFEDVGDRTHRDLERLIQRVVWLMPNAFFVVTGRSRLQWADPALQGQLDYTGPTAWPGLTAPASPIPAQQAASAPGRGGRCWSATSPRGLRRLPRPPALPRRTAAHQQRDPPGHHRPLPRPAPLPRPIRAALPGDPPHPRTRPGGFRPRLRRPDRPHPVRPHPRRTPRPALRQPARRLRPHPRHHRGLSPTRPPPSG
ncbi:hypothetical protein ACFQ3Z_46255 [Streptomyces nogalater]